MIDVRDLQKLADEWFPPAIACDVRLASTTRLFLSRIAGHLIRLQMERDAARYPDEHGWKHLCETAVRSCDDWKNRCSALEQEAHEIRERLEAEIRRLEAEVERLREELGTLEDCNQLQFEETERVAGILRQEAERRAQAESEVRRLRAENETIHQQFMSMNRMLEKTQALLEERLQGKVPR